MVGGDIVGIYVVLNENRPRRDLRVPLWNGELEAQTTHGELSVRNGFNFPIQILLDDAPIEHRMWTDGSTRNASSLAAGDAMTYLIEEGTYDMVAYREGDGSVVFGTQVTLSPHAPLSLELDASQGEGGE